MRFNLESFHKFVFSRHVSPSTHDHLYLSKKWSIFIARANWLTGKHFVRKRTWKGNILSMNCSKYNFLSLCPNNDIEISIFVWHRWYIFWYYLLHNNDFKSYHTWVVHLVGWKLLSLVFSFRRDCVGEYFWKLNDNSSILIEQSGKDQAILCAWNWLFAKHMQIIKLIASCLFDIFVLLLVLCNLVIRASLKQIIINIMQNKSKKRQKQSCVGRQSNPGQLLGRQLCSPLYHRRVGWLPFWQFCFHRPLRVCLRIMANGL